VNSCENVAMPNVDAGAKAWELELAGRIGAAVQARRKALKLTAQQLAERTKRLGYPITRVAISKIEGNMRAGKFDIAELLALAQALELPPVSLLYPGAADQDVQMLPGRHMSTFDAVAGFNGGAGPIWPGREVAALTEKLNRINHAIARSAGMAGEGTLAATVAPIVEADARSKEETK
jgi:transcriptional regulator with XRE-family HTH domain